MANTYFYCNGGTCGSTDVTIISGTCAPYQRYTGQDGSYFEEWQQTLEIQLNAITPVDIDVRFNLHYRSDKDCCGTYETDLEQVLTISAGTSANTFTFVCYQDIYEDHGSGGWLHEYMWQELPSLYAQSTVPDCCLTPPGGGCTLAITGDTITNPIVRGDATGTIKVSMSGITGTSIVYKLDGVTKVTLNASTYTFTGLTSGNYVVLVQDGLCFAQFTYTVADGEFRTGDFNIKSPTGLTAVENPIIIQVGTAINNPNPKPNITTLTVNNTIVDGFSLKFNLTSPYVYTNTFYGKSYPNKPNYFLATILNNSTGGAIGGNSATEIATSLAEVLQNDSVIPKVYYINNNNNVVTLQAKQEGSRFDLSSANVIASTTGITVSQIQAGVDGYDGDITDNYSISCEIMANVDFTNQYPLTGDTGDYNRIAELTLPYSLDNIHRFDISGILKSQVVTPQPDLTLTGSTYLPTVMQPYYVKLSELYPLVANTNTIKKRYKTTISPQWVINSSLDRFVPNDMSDYINVPVEFLTNSPNPKQVQRSSNEFLYFILPKNFGTDLSCRGNMYFYDGTSALNKTFFSISTGTTNAGGVMCMNISYAKLGLANYEISGSTNRKIKRVEIAIYASGGSIQYTEVKKYRFEIDEMPRKFGILFQNALGMYDSFDFIGIVEETVLRESGTYTVPINFNPNGSMSSGQKHLATYDTKVTKKVICNTGWIDETHFDWLMELLKSNNIYSTSTTYSNYLNLTDWTYKKSSLDDLFDCEFSFEWTVWGNNTSI
jgi:hypothetical protein